MNAGRVMQVGGLPPIGIAYPPQSTGTGSPSAFVHWTASETGTSRQPGPRFVTVSSNRTTLSSGVPVLPPPQSTSTGPGVGVGVAPGAGAGAPAGGGVVKRLI